MSIFKRLSEDEIRKSYTHYGRFCFIAPVYCTIGYTPEIAVRNWWPDWIFDVALLAFNAFCFMQQTIDPDFACGFPIQITGEIKERSRC